MDRKKIAIIGGGPAGLMAAEQLVGHSGLEIHLFDAMPSLGRKFLMAGKSGMNITHSEEFSIFLSRYHDGGKRLEDIIADFTPNDIRNWVHELGIDTFIGSSGRVFPTDFKAAPLLRNWLKSLRNKGLHTHVRHRWAGWRKEALWFETPNGPYNFQADATILALGGASWPKLGSDGHWQGLLNLPIHPFKPSNCGFLVNWSDPFKEKFAGSPIKPVILHADQQQVKGEFVISADGIEGSAIYTMSRTLRLELEEKGKATLYLDLCPDRSLEKLSTALNKPRGAKSISTHIKRASGLSGAKAGLLRECLDKNNFTDMNKLADGIKRLPVPLTGMRPIDEAISCAGGVSFDALDDHLMVQQQPGLFLCGEMLNWDAPTGGYLLTACLALGKRAGLGVLQWVK
ncbi:TIGR03862 family flavoprotein [Terasakiella sp. SH-1]|uniref:TIGR03862 family flavoprotein n=1 Tax=Terasakiella sp. SH-1 TaxID=2560057 RepID=UPI0010734D53|nr:TIGR03862 family flavoprotein [Terasakiella sp. SH-1]